jgi:NAD(P)-dependent dehydrogenase (short-subunit alcohol dehydrogenase family)
MPWSAPDLQGRVAVVTGATRGVGKGIARVLGACGATVVVTGRTTVDEAAAEVDAAGGRGIPARVDHTDDAAVAKLFAGLERLDLLVANAWGGYEDYDPEGFTAPFWEQSLVRFDAMFHAGLRAQFTAAQGAAPHMLEAGRGLIVLTGYPGRTHYLGALPYDVIKAGVDRMVTGLAFELRDHGVAALGVWPGFTRTAAVIESFAAGGAEPPPTTHSVEFPGRAVAMLLADDEVVALTGTGLQAAEWAERYGFEDTDGRTIAPFEMPESLRLKNV